MLEILLICAVASYGMFTLQRPGFLLDKLPNLWKKLPKGLHEPLFACGICVSSIWGSIFFCYLVWVEANVPEYNWWIYWLPIVLIGSVGVTAIIDRAVKAFEKHYGYKAPSQKKDEEKWDYLLPYVELRRMLLSNFVNDNISHGHHIVEIGGCHEKWRDNNQYHWFDSLNPATDANISELIWQLRQERKEYVVVIMGLCFEGDLRVLKRAIICSRAAFIEYSDDGISRQQVELITEGLTTRMLIPEFEINSCETAPGQCGQINKRKVIILQP